MIARLLQTAFFTSIFAYLAFILIDYREPGFVSNVISVHIAGAVALVLVVVWAFVAKRGESRQRVLPWVLGAAGALIVWSEGASFGDFRGLLTIAVLVLPWLVNRALVEKE